MFSRLLQVLSALATLTCYLLGSKQSEREGQKQLSELREKLQQQADQRHALYDYCSRLGVPEVRGREGEGADGRGCYLV